MNLRRGALALAALLLLTGCGQREAAVPPAVSPAAPAAASDPAAMGETRLRLIFAGGEAQAVLYDSPTARSLLAQLPAAVSLENFGAAEKIASFPQPLATAGAPPGYDPTRGDLACYGPWGNLAIYTREQPYAEGLIPLGRVESGLEALAALPAGTSLRVEVLG